MVETMEGLGVNSGDAPLPMETRLGQLIAEYGDNISVREIVEVVDSLMGSLHGDLTPQDLRVYGELESLARYIYQAKKEISEIRPEDISTEHIPTASDELDAIGSHLEDATGTILDACEALDAFGVELQDQESEQLGAIVIQIYEACNFQDLSGQRITKIVKTLQNIELRIDQLLRAFGHDTTQAPDGKPAPAQDNRSADDKLLNGPQTPQNANSQADIDALLSAFD